MNLSPLKNNLDYVLISQSFLHYNTFLLLLLHILVVYIFLLVYLILLILFLIL